MNNPTIFEQLKKKYDAIGQDVNVHLEGLLNAKPITYWDYIQTDALLNLQIQRTLLPDEMVFKDEVAKKFLGTLCVGRYTPANKT